MTNFYAKSLIGSFVKLVVFSFIILLDFGAIYSDVLNIHKNGFEENGYVEWMQEIQLIISFIFLMPFINKNPVSKPALIFITGCLIMATIREYNNFFNDDIFHGAWSILVITAALITAFYLYKTRKYLLESFYLFTQTPSYGIVLGGFMVTFIFSRLMGIPKFWHLILGKNYIRYAERAAEESIELIGYTLITFGVILYALTIKKETVVNNI